MSDLTSILRRLESALDDANQHLRNAISHGPSNPTYAQVEVVNAKRDVEEAQQQLDRAKRLAE